MLIISPFECGVELFVLFIQCDFLSHATLDPSKFIILWISQQMLCPHFQGANYFGIKRLRSFFLLPSLWNDEFYKDGHNKDIEALW